MIRRRCLCGVWKVGGRTSTTGSCTSMHTRSRYKRYYRFHVHHEFWMIQNIGTFSVYCIVVMIVAVVVGIVQGTVVVMMCITGIIDIHILIGVVVG